MEQKQSVPNSTAVLILGILSLVFTCCYGILGLILGIVALVLASSGLKAYRANPEMYTSLGNLKAGRVCAIIGVFLSVIFIIFIILYITVFGHAFSEIFDQVREQQMQMQMQ